MIGSFISRRIIPNEELMSPHACELAIATGSQVPAVVSWLRSLARERLAGLPSCYGYLCMLGDGWIFHGNKIEARVMNELTPDSAAYLWMGFRQIWFISTVGGEDAGSNSRSGDCWCFRVSSCFHLHQVSLVQSYHHLAAKFIHDSNYDNQAVRRDNWQLWDQS